MNKKLENWRNLYEEVMLHVVYVSEQSKVVE